MDSVKNLCFSWCEIVCTYSGHHRPCFSYPISETAVRFLCANLQNLSFCQYAFAVKLVCRDFVVLSQQHVTVILHTSFLCSS
jgi:hypothetical protein